MLYTVGPLLNDMAPLMKITVFYGKYIKVYKMHCLTSVLCVNKQITVSDLNGMPFFSFFMKGTNSSTVMPLYKHCINLHTA